MQASSALRVCPSRRSEWWYATTDAKRQIRKHIGPSDDVRDGLRQDWVHSPQRRERQGLQDAIEQNQSERIHQHDVHGMQQEIEIVERAGVRAPLRSA